MVTSKEVKEWLKSHGKTYVWLANQIYVSPHTVNGWLSNGKSIPKLRQEQIRDFIACYEQERAGEHALQSCLTLALDAEMFDCWNEAAGREGKLIREWVIDSLDQIARGER